MTPAARERRGPRRLGSVVAFLDRGEHPAGNWLGGNGPLSRATRGRRRRHAARRAARGLDCANARPPQCVESRLGGGSLYFRFTPGQPALRERLSRRVDRRAEGRLRGRRRRVRSTSLRAARRQRAEACSTRRRRSSSRRRRRSSARICDRRSRTAGARSGDLRQRGLRALRPTTLLPLGLLRLPRPRAGRSCSSAACRGRSGLPERRSTRRRPCQRRDRGAALPRSRRRRA